MNFAPFAVLDVLFVQDGIEDVLLTGQACLPAFSGQKVVLDATSAKGGMGPSRVGTGLDGADLRLECVAKFGLFFDLLIRDGDEDGNGINE